MAAPSAGDRVPDALQEELKAVQIRPPGVELPRRARMKSDLPQRVAVQNGDQPEDILGGAEAEPQLDGEPPGDGGSNLLEERPHDFREGEQPGSAPFFGHRPVGAAEVPVHIRIAHVEEAVRQMDEIFRVVAQDLGFDLHPPVSFGQEVPQVPVVQARGRARRDEGRQGSLKSVEMLGEGGAENGVGEALERGQNQLGRAACMLHGGIIRGAVSQVKRSRV
ncbi:MAG: hypothetical protein MUF46_09590, partial [Desulfobacterales bacterium]|nr:hypothetical protein [Desulfobacterales bacterium]